MGKCSGALICRGVGVVDLTYGYGIAARVILKKPCLNMRSFQSNLERVFPGLLWIFGFRGFRAWGLSVFFFFWWEGGGKGVVQGF